MDIYFLIFPINFSINIYTPTYHKFVNIKKPGIQAVTIPSNIAKYGTKLR